MKKLRTALLLPFLLIAIAACKKTDNTLSVPVIRGINLYDLNAQFYGNIGTPDIKDSAVHVHGTNHLTIFPNPVQNHLNILFKLTDSVATIKTSIEAVNYADHPDSIQVNNTSLFGKGAVYTNTQNITNTVFAGFAYTADSLPDGFYRLTVIIQTANYKDSLYENLWIKK